MSQKIPAFYYIKNNKRRVAVLITSLAMFFVITYTSMFLLSVSSETFRSVLTETSSHIQYITFGAKDLEFGKTGTKVSQEDIYMKAVQQYITFGVKKDLEVSKTGAKVSPKDIYMEAVYKKYNEIKGGLKKCSGIKDAFIVQAEYSYITSLIGNYYIEIPMLNKEQMNTVLKHMGATLSEGRLPDKAGEVVLDRKIMKNYGHKTGDALDQNKNVKITGVIDCDYYFGCGLANGNKTFLNPMLCVLTDGTVKDLENTIKKQGIVLKHSKFIDLKEGEKDLQTEIIDTISSSTNIIFIGILIIVGILVVIVSISYMRDRRSEWCLYASVGYSRKTIYFSILRELLFTFITAFIIASAITIILMKMLDILLITELGLRCVYFIPEPFIQILCSYIALFGIMQIPVRFEINKIKTIDAIDDDI